MIKEVKQPVKTISEEQLWGATLPPTHLAEIIKAEMRTRRWSLNRLVMEMGPHFSERDWGICKLSWEMFFAVRDPNVILGDDMAAQLETAFGVDRQFFVNIHDGWRAAVAKAKP